MFRMLALPPVLYIVNSVLLSLCYVDILYAQRVYIKKFKIHGEVFMMRRSKLETYIDILRVLAHRGPLKLTHIMYKANVNCSALKEYMDFLIKQDLVEERTVGEKRVVYVITQRGITVIKAFRELKQVLPITEETNNTMPILY